jgi:aryl-alcohol dehydrogenase-like predicted oxidoreductase
LLDPLHYIDKLGIGTVQFGLSYGISNVGGQTSTEEVTKILHFASQYKIKLIDTAASYGNSEKVLGENELSRFTIVSKYMPPTVCGRTITSQLTKSLHDLKVNHLYGYLAHRPGYLLHQPSEWDELLRLKEKGLIQKIGFSLNTPDELERLLEDGFYPDLIQIPFNYFDQRFTDHIIALREKGCEIHARSAFLQGLFFTNTEKLNNYFDEIKKSIKSLQDSVTYLPGALLKFVLKKDFIDKVIIGVDKVEYLESNIKTLHLAEDLSEFNFGLSDKFLVPSNWPEII